MKISKNVNDNNILARSGTTVSNPFTKAVNGLTEKNNSAEVIAYCLAKIF